MEMDHRVRACRAPDPIAAAAPHTTSRPMWGIGLCTEAVEHAVQEGADLSHGAEMRGGPADRPLPARSVDRAMVGQRDGVMVCVQIFCFDLKVIAVR